MKQNDFLVLFTINNTRIFNGEDDYGEMRSWPNVFFNPDLSLVKGIPPHFWKIKNDQIVPMNWMERYIRMRTIRKRGMINKIERLTLAEIEAQFNHKYDVLPAAIAIMAFIIVIQSGVIIRLI